MSKRNRSFLLASLLPVVLLGSVFAVVQAQSAGAPAIRQKRWSNPATWPDGKVPAAGDKVTIAAGKEVVLDVDGPTAPIKDPRGNLHMGASASTTVNRKDFGVNGAGAAVGDDVPITIDMELVRLAPAP